MKWIGHIVQGVLTLGFLMAGITKLFSSIDQIREFYTDPLGYAPSFMYLIGAVETIAALTLIAGYRWRLAAAGASLVLIVIMIGAIISLVMASAVAGALLPAVYLILLIALLVRLVRYETVFKIRQQRVSSR